MTRDGLLAASCIAFLFLPIFVYFNGFQFLDHQAQITCTAGVQDVVVTLVILRFSQSFPLNFMNDFFVGKFYGLSNIRRKHQLTHVDLQKNSGILVTSLMKQV